MCLKMWQYRSTWCSEVTDRGAAVDGHRSARRRWASGSAAARPGSLPAPQHLHPPHTRTSCVLGMASGRATCGIGAMFEEMLNSRYCFAMIQDQGADLGQGRSQESRRGSRASQLTRCPAAPAPQLRPLPCRLMVRRPLQRQQATPHHAGLFPPSAAVSPPAADRRLPRRLPAASPPAPHLHPPATASGTLRERPPLRRPRPGHWAWSARRLLRRPASCSSSSSCSTLAHATWAIYHKAVASPLGTTERQLLSVAGATPIAVQVRLCYICGDIYTHPSAVRAAAGRAAVGVPPSLRALQLPLSPCCAGSWSTG